MWKSTLVPVALAGAVLVAQPAAPPGLALYRLGDSPSLAAYPEGEAESGLYVLVLPRLEEGAGSFLPPQLVELLKRAVNEASGFDVFTVTSSVSG